MNKLTAVLSLIVLAVAAIADDSPPTQEFADWTLPVPADATVHEYAPVGDEERQDLVYELVEDLVLGGDPTDENAVFYRPLAVVAAANGNIFVVEHGNQRVQMFSETGEFLKTLGGAGQGSGSFQQPGFATIAGDHLVVFDFLSRRLSVWTEDGDHLADHAISGGNTAMQMSGFDDGSLAMMTMELDVEAAMSSGTIPNPRTVVATYSIEGERLVELDAVEDPPIDLAAMGNPGAMAQLSLDRLRAPAPQFAGAPGDIVYVMRGDEYQVQAMKPDGTTLWALRVSMPRPLFPQAQKDELMSGSGPLAEAQAELGMPNLPLFDFSSEDLVWPEFGNAIAGILTDGAGRLYVSPYSELAAAEEETASGDEARPRPVDVYAPDGRRIASGLGAGTWFYARGDFVYNITTDPDTEEDLVVRSRLVLSEQ